MTSKENNKILIVDDATDLTELMKEQLEENHFHVERASNGKEALDLIQKEGLPDLILLDMNMPVMDGWTFAQHFYDEYGRSCPIVIMTAEDDSRTRAMEIGADSYLGKPFNLESLSKLVASMTGAAHE